MEARQYYEELAQKRLELIKDLSKKKEMGIETFWSAAYGMKFKEKLYAEIINTIKNKPNCAVLDIGCGQGDDLFFISRKCNYRGYGLDFSLIQLGVALRRNVFGNIKFFQADLNSLPLKNNLFDIVIFSEVIEHLEDASRVLNEIKRVLKNDGKLFISTPNRYDYFHFLGSLLPLTLRKRLLNLIHTRVDIDPRDFLRYCKIKEHEHLYSLSEIARIFKKSNFLIEKFIPGSLTVPISKLFDHCIPLQFFWEKLDGLLIKLYFSKYFYRHLIFVLRKDIDGGKS
jgi:ubiquinone/menaquinone biosynthesis C-methylase UbiE